MCPDSNKIICCYHDSGRCHDYRMFKESGVAIHPTICLLGDSGYQGIHKIHHNSLLPKKRSKKNPLTLDDKKQNAKISSQRILIENVFATIKYFKIIAERYRNRRKRFGLRFTLICAIFNMQRGSL